MFVKKSTIGNASASLITTLPPYVRVDGGQWQGCKHRVKKSTIRADSATYFFNSNFDAPGEGSRTSLCTFSEMVLFFTNTGMRKQLGNTIGLLKTTWVELVNGVN